MTNLHRIPGTFLDQSSESEDARSKDILSFFSKDSVVRNYLFPFLQRKVHNGQRVIYLDSAATSQKPRPVIEAMNRYNSEYAANVHRGVYSLSQEATDQYERVRGVVARFLGLEDRDAGTDSEVVFTSGTTESINLVAHSWGRKNLKAGDEIVVTRAEHHANFVPWQQLAKEMQLRFTIIELGVDGRPDFEEWKNAMSRKPKLVAFSALSNVLGILWPVEKLARVAKDAGAVVLVDAAQWAAHLPIRMSEWPSVDFLAFSAHKCLGPTGTGVLFARSNVQADMQPYQMGGDMIRRVDDFETVFADSPSRFEAGTPAIAEVIGMGTALEFLMSLDLKKVREHELKLFQRFFEKIKGLPAFEWVGPKLEAVGLSERSGVISFGLKGVHPHDLATFLDLRGICIRAGHLCAQPLLRKFGVASVNRASFSIYNSEEDVDALVEGLVAAEKYFLK